MNEAIVFVDARERIAKHPARFAPVRRSPTLAFRFALFSEFQLPASGSAESGMGEID
jgi:hypothetical protein